MKHLSMTLLFTAILFISLTSAQETHNLEIIWTIPGNPVLYAFGVTMAGGDIDNDGRSDIIVTADTFDENGGTTPYLGRAYLYYGNGIGDTIPDIVFKSPLAKGTTPTRVHSADINGDNYDEIIIGEDQGDAGYGGVTIFWGGNPVDTVPDIILHGRGRGGWFFGCAVSSGDVNGDSFADLIVGSYGTANLKGRVYIYFGGPSFDTIPDVILNGGHQGDYEGFGTSVSGKGDVNNDGYQDMIIGAANFGSSYNGRIYVYFGGNPVDTIADVSMIGEGPNQQLGWARVDLLKNLNDFDCATASTSLWPRGVGYCPGKVYVLFGGNYMDSIPDIWMIGRMDTSGLGTQTASAGDLNTDGCDEIITGAPLEYDHKGTAYIYLGGSLLDTTPDGWIRGEVGGDGIGWYVATAGDVNGDGIDEFMVSNYTGRIPRVWVCKYTGPGIGEERQTQNAERLTLEINPNPAKGVIRVRGPFSERTIKIFDICGKMIKEIATTASQSRNDGMVVISLKGINPGIYFLRLSKETKKFLVVK